MSETQVPPHDFVAVYSADEGWCWRCGDCQWVGYGLTSEDAAEQEHHRIAADQLKPAQPVQEPTP